MTECVCLTDALAARPRERECAIHDSARQGFMLRVQPNGAQRRGRDRHGFMTCDMRAPRTRS